MKGLVTVTKELHDTTREYSRQVKGDSASKVKINSGLWHKCIRDLYAYLY